MTNTRNFAQTNVQEQLLNDPVGTSNDPVWTSFVLINCDALRLVYAVITQYEALGLDDSKIAKALNRRELTRTLSKQIWTKEQVAINRGNKLDPRWRYIKMLREESNVPSPLIIEQEECLADFVHELIPIMNSKQGEKWMWAKCAKELNLKGLRDPFGRKFTAHWAMYWFFEIKKYASSLN